MNLERSTARLPTHDVFESVVLHLIEYVMQFRRETVLQGGRTIFAFRLSFYLLPIHLRLLTKSFGLCVYLLLPFAVGYKYNSIYEVVELLLVSCIFRFSPFHFSGYNSTSTRYGKGYVLRDRLRHFVLQARRSQ